MVNATAGNDVLDGTLLQDIIDGLAGDDIIRGLDGEDTLSGGDGADRLEGGIGNDRLDGGAGVDLVSGGDGDDIFRLERPADIVAGDRYVGGTGQDVLLIAADGIDLTHAVIGADIEDLSSAYDPRLAREFGVRIGAAQLSGFTHISCPEITITTAGYADLRGAELYARVFNLEVGGIRLNLAGTFWGNEITGSAGADVVIGGDGQNMMEGGDGNDRLTGGAEQDTLDGGSGSDILSGGDYRDYLTGGLGADRLYGGAGDDFYYVDEAADYVVELADSGYDQVFSTANYRLRNGVERLELTGEGAINGVGNGLANVVVGNDAANILDGAGGADAMVGGAGNDIYIVDNVGDDVVESGPEEDLDIVRSSVSYSIAWDAHVESLVLTGARAARATGNFWDNRLVGNVAANVLLGDDGQDSLVGGGGNDVLDGGRLPDTLSGGEGADRFTFGFGYPTGRQLADVILDFSRGEGDLIDLRQIDADQNSVDINQAFRFVGTDAFSRRAGELRYEISGNSTWLEGDLDGNGDADFSVRLVGAHDLVATDFLL